MGGNREHRAQHVGPGCGLVPALLQYQGASTTAATPNGARMKKRQGRPSDAVNTPPSTSPATM
ncbi:hypothetical protein ACWDWO_06440 [Actinopolymorpha singaporensis]